MNILFNDILQKSDAPKSLISPALADRYRYTGPLDITLDKTRKFDALGIGGTDAGTISINGYIPWNSIHDYGLKRVIYVDGKYIGISNYDIYMSQDCLVWSKMTSLNQYINDIYLNDIAFGNGRYVFVASKGIVAYSTDIINWTIISGDSWSSNPQYSTIRYIIYANGKFVAGDANGKTKYSADGSTWLPANGSLENNFRAAFGNGRFVVVGYSAGTIAYSSDGMEWNLTPSPFGTNVLYLQHVVFGNGIFVAAGEGGRIAYSHDGIVWNAVSNSPVSSFINGLAFGNGVFMLSTSMQEVAYSVNGIVWIKEIGNISLFLSTIMYGNNKFILRTSGGDNLYTDAENIKNINQTLSIDDSGLYRFPEMETGNIRLTCDGSYIGRLALGRAVRLGTAIPKEPAFASTHAPRRTLSGQVIPGTGGYRFRRVSVDTRYKIGHEAMDEIIEGRETIARGYPFFISFDEEYEHDRLPFRRLYAADTEQQNISFESSVTRFLFSRRFVFEEAF